MITATFLIATRAQELAVAFRHSASSNVLIIVQDVTSKLWRVVFINFYVALAQIVLVGFVGVQESQNVISSSGCLHSEQVLSLQFH